VALAKLISKLEVDMPKRIKVECYYCGGRGHVACDCNGGVRGTGDTDCSACGGSEEHYCPHCRGVGYVWEDE